MILNLDKISETQTPSGQVGMFVIVDVTGLYAVLRVVENTTLIPEYEHRFRARDSTVPNEGKLPVRLFSQ